MNTVSCPSCKTTLQLPPSAAGKQVRCPKCQHIFKVPAESSEPIYNVPAPPPAVPAPIPAPPPARTDDPWDDDDRRGDRRGDRRDERRRRDRDDDDDDPPRRRRRDYEDDDDDYGGSATRRIRRREHAKNALMGPSIGMMVAGFIGLICPLCGMVNAFDNNRGRPDPEFFVGLLVGVAMLYIWPIALLIGANAMRTASGKGLIIFGCVVAFLPCSPMWLLSMPMGIWALVVLNSPEVSENIL